MAYWSNLLTKISDEFRANFRDTQLVGVLLSKSDGSPDLQQSDGNGAAKVSLSSVPLPTGAATSAG